MRRVLCAWSFFRGMNLFFALLSVGYIFAIFFFADSPAISGLTPYNPFSLLHIPLYGILTILNVFAMIPFSFSHFFRIRTIHKNEISDPLVPNDLNDLHAINARNRFIVAGSISFVVAIADEYHQAMIPTREGSFADVLLDLVGIVLAVLFTLQSYKWQKAGRLDAKTK